MLFLVIYIFLVIYVCVCVCVCVCVYVCVSNIIFNLYYLNSFSHCDFFCLCITKVKANWDINNIIYL